MNKCKLTIEYDGTGYRGWQGQTNARTIQGTLVEAAERLLGCEVDIQGAGRTDAGVHALGQVAHLATKRRLAPGDLQFGLNDLLPSGIHVRRVEAVRPDFHARHDARRRIYVYIISRTRTAFSKRFVWWVKDRLQAEPMVRAARLFEGFHDFSSFADRRMDKGASTQVLVDRVGIEILGEGIVLTVSASHFLWKMVRRMAGVLVEVGRGSLPEQAVYEMLTYRSDEPARFTAPPSGLFLAQVLYDGDCLEPIRLPLWREYLPPWD
jgi:tRNA pseudouridine38-40 synthase